MHVRNLTIDCGCVGRKTGIKYFTNSSREYRTKMIKEFLKHKQNTDGECQQIDQQ